jgi:hypothetical protein
LPAVADRWVTEDFLNPDYVRIDGKPLLVVYEINDAAQLWGGAAGVNKGIEIIQQAAKRHGLPGVFVVGTHQEPAEYTQGCFLNCGYDGDLLAQHWDALSKYTFNDAVKPIDGPIPYSQLAAAEEGIWQRYAQQSAFHFVPSVPAGWDERSSNELVKDSSGVPRLFWFPRTADEVGGLLHDAIDRVNNNPQTRVAPAPAPPSRPDRSLERASRRSVRRTDGRGRLQLRAGDRAGHRHPLGSSAEAHAASRPLLAGDRVEYAGRDLLSTDLRGVVRRRRAGHACRKRRQGFGSGFLEGMHGHRPNVRHRPPQ